MAKLHCLVIGAFAAACTTEPGQPAQPPARAAQAAVPDAPAAKAKARRFELAMTLVAPAWRDSGGVLRLWAPVPTAGADQDVEAMGELPAGFKRTREPRYGNEMVYFEGPAAQAPLPATLRFMVTRREIVRARESGGASHTVSQAMHDELKRYLEPNRLVPVGGFVSDIAAKIGTTQAASPMQARAIYDYVLDHMQYKKEGTGWGTGSTKWACESGYGNCTDFHALFISLCRTKQIPARFEIGYPLPEERGKKELAGYHCWAYFWLDTDGWVPVDISEADKNPKLTEYYFGSLSENRVRLSAERDIVLEPAQAGEPVNFFVRPYAEVDGKPQPVEWKLAIEDR
ncbi:MAG: transglutaminase domain-containing protein [Planctomycetota bacterium]